MELYVNAYLQMELSVNAAVTALALCLILRCDKICMLCIEFRLPCLASQSELSLFASGVKLSRCAD